MIAMLGRDADPATARVVIGPNPLVSQWDCGDRLVRAVTGRNQGRGFPVRGR